MRMQVFRTLLQEVMERLEQLMTRTIWFLSFCCFNCDGEVVVTELEVYKANVLGLPPVCTHCGYEVDMGLKSLDGDTTTLDEISEAQAILRLGFEACVDAEGADMDSLVRDAEDIILQGLALGDIKSEEE